jgi:hypothetical protein
MGLPGEWNSSCRFLGVPARRILLSQKRFREIPVFPSQEAVKYGIYKKEMLELGRPEPHSSRAASIHQTQISIAMRPDIRKDICSWSCRFLA